MLNRDTLRPNNQEFSPVSGAQMSFKYPKAIEKQTTASWRLRGRGQQGESISGEPYESQIIRKGKP